jgi:hypothetical protein
MSLGFAGAPPYHGNFVMYSPRGHLITMRGFAPGGGGLMVGAGSVEFGVAPLVISRTTTRGLGGDLLPPGPASEPAPTVTVFGAGPHWCPPTLISPPLL